MEDTNLYLDTSTRWESKAIPHPLGHRRTTIELAVSIYSPNNVIKQKFAYLRVQNVIYCCSTASFAILRIHYLIFSIPDILLPYCDKIALYK